MDDTLVRCDNLLQLPSGSNHPQPARFVDIPIHLRQSIYQYLPHSFTKHFEPNWLENHIEYGDYPERVSCGYSEEAVQFWIDQYLSDPRHRWLDPISDTVMDGAVVVLVSPPLIFDVLEQRKMLAVTHRIPRQFQWLCRMQCELELIMTRHGPLPFPTQVIEAVRFADVFFDFVHVLMFNLLLRSTCCLFF